MKAPILNIRHLRALAAIALAIAVARSGSAVTFTLLHSFNGNDGNSPVGGLFWPGDGYFYGTTTLGGINNYPSGDGTIFRIDPFGANFSSIYSFAEDPGGFKPYAGVTGFNGELVGTSFTGGNPASTGDGAVVLAYKSGPTSWGLAHWYDFTEKPDFTAGTNGGYPEGALVQGSDGNFYGTTSSGGTNNSGTVFQIDPITFTLTTIYSFSGGADGAAPHGNLVQGNNGSLNFYGTTQEGGISNNGTAFSIGYFSFGAIHFWSLTTLHGFTGGADGGFPQGGLVQGSDGFFYGTTFYGGTNAAPSVSGGGGTVWKMDSVGNLTLLHSFGDDHPNPLIAGTDGNFYGTTRNGSSVEPNGTVFQITPSGAFSTLWTFNGTNGSNPSGALIEYHSFSFAGQLVGTTAQGGTNGLGAVFSLGVPSLGTSTITNSGLSISGANNNSPSHANVSILSAAGLNYQLQSVDSLGQSSWNNVGSSIPSSGGLLNLSDPNTAGTTQRFYRVMITQQ